MTPTNPTGEYLKWLGEWAKTHSDGCTGVPDIHLHCCWQHDYAYQTGMDPREAFEGRLVFLSRRQADAIFRHCNEEEDPLGWFSPIAWVRWVGVRLFGRKYYHKS